MSQKYALGIDGGGTKTGYVVADLSTLNNLSIPKEGITTLRRDSPFNALTGGVEVVDDVLNFLVKTTGIKLSEFDFIFMGVSGVDSTETQKSLEDRTRSAGVNSGTSVEVRNDLYIATRAMYTPGGTSAAQIIGTGTNCGVELSDGSLHNVGGTGYLLSDRGRAGSSLGFSGLTYFCERMQEFGDINKATAGNILAAAKKLGDSLVTLIADRIGKKVEHDATSQPSIRNQPIKDWLMEKVYGKTPSTGSSSVRFGGEFAIDVITAAGRTLFPVKDYEAIPKAERPHKEAYELVVSAAQRNADLLKRTLTSSPEKPSQLALVGGLVANPGIIQDVILDKVKSEIDSCLKVEPFPDGNELCIRALLGSVARNRN